MTTNNEVKAPRPCTIEGIVKGRGLNPQLKFVSLKDIVAFKPIDDTQEAWDAVAGVEVWDAVNDGY